jgi:molybdopterin/thiamine biosynthesis adenylyltransferase
MTPGRQEDDLTTFLSKNKSEGRPPAVDEAVLVEAAGMFGVSDREVHLACLAAGLVPARYARQISVFGLDGQVRLLESCVGIAGAGGLGGFLCELLARAGVGQLVVADRDAFEPTNLNRQLLATSQTLGLPKATVAAARVASINPAVTVRAVTGPITARNAPDIFAGVQVVADALDNVPDRFMLQTYTKQTRIPFVFGAVAGLMGQVTTVFPGDPGLERIFGPAQDRTAAKDDPEPAVAPMTPALTASRQAGEIIQILLGRTDGLLRGRLWVADMGSGRTMEVDLG